MRYIRTSNNYVEFIEANNEGQILATRGFQFGELYFKIQNSKVTFYLNDQENPWRNDVWSIDIPFTLDDVVYDNEDDASAALHQIMNDSFQEQLDELQEELAAEIARAQEAEDQLDDKIDDETARAISAETHLQDEITALSGTVATFDSRITRNAQDISALTDDLNAEIARSVAKDAEHDALLSGLTDDLDDLEDALNAEINRSTAKDAEHDALLSGLTNSLNNEITRAISAETNLHNEIMAERDRALGAESALTNALNAEILRSTNKDTEHDVLLSGLTNSIATINAKDAQQDNRLTIIENSMVTSTELAADLALKADKANAVASAEYVSANKLINFKNISGAVISSIDATDFIKDGMVDNVEIKTVSGASVLAITFNVDAGKEEIDIPLSEIFDPTNYYTKQEINNIVNDIESGVTHDLANYYTKSEVDASQAIQDAKIDALSGKVDTISGDVITLSGEVQSLSGDMSNYYTKTEVDTALSGKQDTLSAGTGIDITNNVISATGQGATYTAGRAIDITNNIISLDLPISAGTGTKSIMEGNATSANGNYSHAEGRSTKATGQFSHAEGSSTEAYESYSHAEGQGTKANGTYSHVEGNNTIANNEAEHASGQYNISNTGSTNADRTLFSVGNGTSASRHNAFEIRKNGDIYIVSGNTDIKLQDHLGGGGIDSGTVQTMIDNSISGKQDTLTAGTNISINNNVISAVDTTYTAGDGISISNQNVISTVTKFWCGTQAQYDAITNKDSNTVYMIHE